MHPLVRKSLKTLSAVDPLAQYRRGVTERIFTNPHASDFGAYPCPYAIDIQARFAGAIETNLERLPRSRRITADNVLFTQGSVMGIDLLIRTFCEPNIDGICITSPTFPAYAHYARAYDIEIRDVPLIGEKKDILDIASIRDTHAKLVFLCNPTSPMGSLLRLDRIADICERSDSIVVVDEAYIEFSDADSALALIEESRNLVVLRTFSKAWGLAGLRVGAVVGPPSVLDSLRILQDPFAFDVAAQRAVADRLNNLDWLRASIARIRVERDRLARELARIPIVVHVFPSHANFICITVSNFTTVFNRCVESEVLVTNVSQQLSDSIRVAVGDRVDNDRILELLASMTQARLNSISDNPTHD
jgi:histidinol-phosphate aminotransferase